MENRPGSSANASVEPQFEDVTASAGVQFKHYTGARGRYFMPETMGAGCGFFDYDGDGDADILLLNGRDWEPAQHGRHTPALFRNDEGWFREVTRECGLDIELYAMGCAAADFDNDGDLDLYLTGVGGNRLLENRGARFADITSRAGVRGGGWSTGAAWLDYDRDGRPDLFVARYVTWTPATDRFCSLTGKRKSYCTPQDYDGTAGLLYRNLGAPRGHALFENVSARAGIAAHRGKGLGVLAHDGNDDGWPDLFVANDTEPNFLFRNDGGRRFKEIGLDSGFALGDTGRPRAGMGIDHADVDGKGGAAIAVTNFAGEGLGLFERGVDGLYSDEAARHGLREPTVPLLGFGACFLDANLDGRPDLFVANGHVHDDIAEFQPQQRHAQTPLLLVNYGGHFRAVQSPNAPTPNAQHPTHNPQPPAPNAHRPTPNAHRPTPSAQPPTPNAQRPPPTAQRPAPNAHRPPPNTQRLNTERPFRPMVARGAAVADFDRDGRPDLLVSTNGGTPRLLRNVTPGRHTWLRLTLRGTRSGRDALGARVEVRSGGGRVQTGWVRSGNSYCSQSELPLTFGLDGRDGAETVIVSWPRGRTTEWRDLRANRTHVLTEG